MKRVGVLGLGLMGTAIARRLLASGFEVLGYDVDAQKRHAASSIGVKAEATAAVVIAGCELNLVCVFNTDQVEDVIAGPGGGVDAVGQGGTGARIFVVT